MQFPRNELQSKETDAILNTIDKLRQIGVGEILELPQIIVCGDQSSGKSSVLNAVSTLKFPTKDGLCTRFATEVIMRPGAPEQIVVSIVPGSDRSTEDKTALNTFRKINVDMDDIESIIDEASNLMGIDPRNSQAKRFSDDILRFEVTGPRQPSLTLVDLPGLFQAGIAEQTQEDMKSVEELVLRYMRNKRSVILAVISAQSQFVLQSVTRLAGEVDPKGLRTIGVITKPDKLEIDSDSEKRFIELAENKTKYLHRGWHVLVNRKDSTRTSSQEQRDDFEKTFLSTGVWAKLPAHHKGVFTLRTRLSIALREHILEGLPDLMHDAEVAVSRCRDILARLGASRSRPEDRQKYLIHAAQVFSVTMRSCINGSYDDKFFIADSRDEYKQKRLRAVVQDTLEQYSRVMQRYGHAKNVIDDDDAEYGEDTEYDGGQPAQVTQTQFEDSVMELMRDSRGRELMVTHNSMIVRDLFQEQSAPWVKLTDDYRTRLVEAAERCIDLVLFHATDGNTGLRVKNSLIKPGLKKLLASLDKAISQLMKGYRESHPITYNRGLAESIAKAKQKRAEKLFADKYERAINQGGQVVATDTLKWLFEEQIVVPPTALPRFAASEAIIEMQAYYSIARENLVDNFGRLVIEDCLISQMPDLFSPESIAALDDDAISEMAMETESATWERNQTNDRLDLCHSTIEELKSIQRMRIRAFRLHDVRSVPSSPGSEASDYRSSSGEQIDASLSRLDLGLSEREDEQSLVNEMFENSSYRS